MNLKTLLISTLIVVIACASCTNASRLIKSRRTKNKSTTQHSDSRHSSADSYPKQQTSNQNPGNVANSHTYNAHSPNHPAAHSRIDTSRSSNQPVYIVNSEQQNPHPSGNDDFIAGYVAGSAVAHRKRRRKTTTIAPSTTKTPCLNEAPMPNNNLPQQQNNPETVSPLCEAISPSTESPTVLNINADNTQSSENAVMPEIRRKRRRKTTTVVPITTKNPYLNEAVVPYDYTNQPQQQNLGDNNFGSRETEISTASPGNTNVNANNILFK